MRRLVFRLLQSLQRALPSSLRTVVARQRRRQLHVVVGSAQEPRAFALFGDDRWESRYVELYLGESAASGVQRTFATHLTGVARAAVAQARASGLAVLDHAPSHTPAELLLLCVPTFVAMRVDLLDSVEAMRGHFNRSARNDLKKLATRDYRFDIVRDPEWAQEFYARYHHPSIAGRHGDQGFVMTADRIAQRVRQHGGEFVRAYLGDQLVGGLLCERKGDSYHLGRLGWLDGDRAWTALGVVTALDWHALTHARAIGCTNVQFGGTPPVIEHGVFRAKTKWGAQLDAAESNFGDSYLLLDPSHRDVQRLFGTHSLIFRRADSSLAVLSGRSRVTVAPAPLTSSSIPQWTVLRATPEHAGDAWARWCANEATTENGNP